MAVAARARRVLRVDHRRGVRTVDVAEAQDPDHTVHRPGGARDTDQRGSLGITRYRAAVDAVLPAGGVAVVAFVTRRRQEPDGEVARSEPPDPPVRDEPRVPVAT